MVVARQQTLKELVAPNMENQPLCINIDNNVNFELKYGFIHLLPIFNGLVGEDPHTHLKEFHMVCDAIQPSKDLLELPVGPFTRLGVRSSKKLSIDFFKIHGLRWTSRGLVIIKSKP
jgi:hypothetical protein